MTRDLYVRLTKIQVYVTNFYDKFLTPTSTHKYDQDQPLLDQSEHLAYDPRWEFPKDRLIFS